MSLLVNIVKYLRSQPTPLADLQTMTQVSLPTLRKAVQELTEQQWIKVVGQAEANGGRPAMLFGLSDAYHVIIGVHVQLPGMRLILSDLNGHILDEVEMFHTIQPTPDQVVQTVIDYTQKIQSRFEERNLLGIGIAAPGFTDPETGEILTIGRVEGWQNFPICQRISTRLNTPVKIANDVDCMAFAEFQHTGKTFDRNLAYFGFDEGVKVSMFLNGELYKGPFGNAGLIRSEFLRLDDISAEDTRRILTISGMSQMFEEQYAQLDDEMCERYAHIIQADHRERIELILASADNTELPLCQSLITTLIEVLSNAIANIFYVIQPDAIVIGGLLGNMPPAAFIALSMSIRKRLPTLFANRAIIEQAQLSSVNSAALGATYHFLESYLFRESLSLSKTV